MCQPSGSWRKCGYESVARGENEKKQRGAQRSVEKGHPAANLAAADGEGEPKTTG